MLKLQYFPPLMQRTDSLEKTPMPGKSESKIRKGWQRRRWSGSITNLMDMNEQTPKVSEKDREALCAAAHGMAESDMN